MLWFVLAAFFLKNIHSFFPPAFLWSQSRFFTAHRNCTFKRYNYNLALWVSSVQAPQGLLSLCTHFTASPLTAENQDVLPGNWSLDRASPLLVLHWRLHFNNPTEGWMKGESGGGCPVGRLHCGACCCYACPPTGDSMGREEEWRGADRAEGVYPFTHAHMSSSHSSRFNSCKSLHQGPIFPATCLYMSHRTKWFGVDLQLYNQLLITSQTVTFFLWMSKQESNSLTYYPLIKTRCDINKYRWHYVFH